MQDVPGSDTPPPASLSPLRVSGLVVTRADLVAALSAFVPGLVDIRPLDGTEDFLLTMGPAPAGSGNSS